MKEKVKSLRDWNRKQRHLSEGEENCIAFHQMYKRAGTPSELLQFFVDSGKATRFSETHERDFNEEDCDG